MSLRAITVLSFFLIVSACGGMPLDDRTKPDENNLKSSRMNPADADSVDGIKPEKIYLLVGIDSRGEPDSRSDAILLARYDRAGNRMKLASIMRDSYVKIPGYNNGYNKINMSYYLGGTKLLKQTIYENFHIKADHVATIDFQGFIQLVDLLAPEGIKANIKPEMIQDMSLEATKGEQVLHGDEILKYVRFRHDSESDFGRVKRQQEVLLQLKDIMYERLYSVDGIFTLPHVIKETFALTDTDMGVKELAELGSIMLFHQIEDVSTLRIPVEGSFLDKSYPHSGAVLQINKEENKRALINFFGE
ncbi:LCP family protein [Peribacillus glennii]|uniref:Regulatory protein MsrR n=1 Tax=Peribacillus glennii TaxID=2303991 RepID=A0A372LHF9_9BACI|nr:LCP family protein [Peribacillus glennii]RFU65424.1 LytR family transcriptional regulator [Peribacillus glennii]